MDAGLRDGRRERLVSCAKRVFALRGYYGTSISQIVGDAGIARGTFYQYFDNKLHVFQSILDSFLLDLQECIKPIDISPGAPAPLSQIQSNLSCVLGLVLNERDLSQILLYHSNTPDPTLQRRLNDFFGQVALMLERSLSLGIAMRLVRPCNTRRTAYFIIGAVKEVVLQITSSQEPQPTVEELMRELVEFGMRGILAEPQASLMERSGPTRNPASVPPVHSRG